MQNFYVKDIIEATGGKLLCGNADTPVNMISTNSKEIGEGCLFVPVIGERGDAHRFIEDAVAAGAVAVLTSEHDSLDLNAACIKVDNTIKAMQEKATAYKRRMTITKKVNTSSESKTTTKEMEERELTAA